MSKIFNSGLDNTIGYMFEDDEITIVDKKTGEKVDRDFDEKELLEDASKAYIKNDIYVMEEPEPVVETIPDTCYIGDVAKLNKLAQEVEANKEPEVIEVEDDIKHHLEAKDFGEYLIVIGDYAEKDFDVFVGTKKELEDHVNNLHLHQTPKVYILKQLPVRTKYEIL